jgi:hypothetical protein
MAAKKPVLALAGVPSVNLMPRPEVERRERLTLSRTWALIAIAALVVGVLIIGGAFAIKFVADQRLVGEQTRTTELLTKLTALSDVSASVKTLNELEGFRADAMTTDAAWAPMIGKITSALPAGTTLIEFTLAPSGVPISTDPTAAFGYSGVLTLGAKAPAAQAAAVAALAKVDGVKVVDAGELASAGKSGFEFAVTIGFDQSVYSGQYAKDGGN